MPHIHLCFLWHMHQPFYKDLLTGEYRLPWTRMHALKDYYGMVKILEDFPAIKQTFNLVPSLVLQVEEYAQGTAQDPYWVAATTPAESLNEAQRHLILEYFFQANKERLIARYPRYLELYERWEGAGREARHAAYYFSTRDYRDLQVLSQLSWFDEEFIDHDPEVQALVQRASDYSPEDHQVMVRKQQEILRAVMAVYREAAARGQIEISTTPFYHPILPLLCDSDIAQESHPGVPLPRKFRHPEDAREQLRRARDFIAERFGRPPVGLWPSEGSVSNEVLALTADTGFEWTATDQGVLERTLHTATTGPGGRLYQPFAWERDGHRLRMIFRDHYLSDLIGFVFYHMAPEQAADDFVRRLAQIGEPCLQAGRDVLIPIILDGENAWEYYHRNGRPFLRALYQRIQEDARFRAVTVSEAVRTLPAERLDTIAAGSWINANFDIWIGAEEDNHAWNLLWEARQFLDATTAPSPEARRLAYEELLIAEGSDWCWWYGPEHESANEAEFDELFRKHLSNVYRALGHPPPEELARPIRRERRKPVVAAPAGPIHPVIDGVVTSYFEWIGAGLYRADHHGGAMHGQHGQRFLVQELHYGTDGASLFLRVDFLPDAEAGLPGSEVHLTLEGGRRVPVTLRLAPDNAEVTEILVGEAGTPQGITAAFVRVLEVSVPLALAEAGSGKLRFQLSFWQDGLPVEALPSEGWLELDLSQSGEWLV